MTLIQSHSLTVNLDNVNYIKPHTHMTGEIGTHFRMNNGRTVQITCPYDVVISQLRIVNMNGDLPKMIKLEY